MSRKDISMQSPIIFQVPKMPDWIIFVYEFCFVATGTKN